MSVRELRKIYLRHVDLFNACVLVAIVATIFSLRITDRPLIGEETRYGTAAREMIASGDILVFRQQAQIFAERPPLTIWTVAAAGLLRGEVDVVAVRLTSIISIVLTSLLLYFYVKSFASAFAAFTAGLIYPTMGQVLQIGRLGESEPLFALLLSSSLLLWHWGYLKKWRPILTWSVGFGCAALAALAKGPQAPVYFVSIIGVYLLVRRDWRFLFCKATVVGAILFVAIIAAWQVPYYMATDWESVVATWTGLAKDRIRTEGLAMHMMRFPLETFACLLPWSPMLLALCFKQVRKRLSGLSPVLTFLIVALVVTYPSVWFAVGARGRYFLPLYPCFAVLIAIIIDRCAAAEFGSMAHHGWRNFQWGFGILTGAGGIACAAIAIAPTGWVESVHQPRLFAVLFAVVSCATCWICFQGSKRTSASWNVANVVSISLLSAIVYVGIVINMESIRWNNPGTTISELKMNAIDPQQLVSLGPIDHRFAFYFENQIEQLQWPTTDRELPADVEYFVFMRRPTDTAESREQGRGRSWHRTPGTLPFEWEEVTTINCSRVIRNEPQPVTVVGKVIRPIRSASNQAATPISREPQFIIR